MNDSPPIRSELLDKDVDIYLKNDNAFKRLMLKVGMADAHYHQKKAWCAVIQNYSALSILSKLPHFTKKGLTSSEIWKKLPIPYDRSNMNKILDNLVKFRFAESYPIESDEGERSAYRQSEVGDYFLRHYSFINLNATEVQKAIQEREKIIEMQSLELVALKEELMKYKGRKT